MQGRVAQTLDAMSPIRPLRVCVVVLSVVFVSEGLAMLVFPYLPKSWQAAPYASLIDASAVSLMTMSALWWTVVRPGRRMFHMRGHLIRSLYDVQERERARIARDLHDQVGQSLTAVMVGLRTIENAVSLDQATDLAHRLRDSAGTALDETRRLARGLSPHVLTDLGLGPAVERLCEELTLSGGPRVEVSLGPGLDCSREAEVDLAAYRAIQEALTNIARHARATRVVVKVAVEDRELTVSVQDDGCGISPQALDAVDRKRGSLGLAGMRERVGLLGGQIQVQSAAGAGTTIQIRLPVSSREA